jgi:hypothetical protein
MKLRSFFTYVFGSAVLVPSLALAQGYTVVPVSLDPQTRIGGTYASGALLQFSKSQRGGKTIQGYVDENGTLVTIPAALFRKELRFAQNFPWLDLVLSPSKVIFFSEKRKAKVLASFEGNKVSVQKFSRDRSSWPVAVNSQGQFLIQDEVKPSGSSRHEPNQLRIRFFDGKEMHTVYQTKLAPNQDGSFNSQSYIDAGFIDDTSRWFVSGGRISGTSWGVFSGVGDGATANITEKTGQDGNPPKDFSWILAAGKELVVSTDASSTIKLSSADGRALATAQGYDFVTISPDGDVFLNIKGTSDISLARLTPNGVATISCPILGDGLKLMYAFKNGNLLVAKYMKGQADNVYLLRKGGSDCSR